MLRRFSYRFSLAPFLVLVLFGFGLQILSPMTLQSQEPENVSQLMQRSRSKINDSLTTGVALQRVISDWSQNSEQLKSDIESYSMELEEFSQRLNSALSSAEEQAGLSKNYYNTLESSSKSITDYVQLTEKQFKEVEKERQAALTSRDRWRTVAIGLAAIAVVEGVILFIR